MKINYFCEFYADLKKENYASLLLVAVGIRIRIEQLNSEQVAFSERFLVFVQHI